MVAGGGLKPKLTARQQGQIAEVVEKYPEFRALGWEPTWAQAPVLLCPKRFILVVGGEGSGKSELAEKFLLTRCTETEGAGLYWLVGEDYAQTSKEYEMLLADLGELKLLKNATSRVDPGHIDLTDGSRIETRSANDPVKLTRDGPDGIVQCEAGQNTLETYHRLQGRVGRNRGWLFICGTLEAASGQGWYPRLRTAWQHGTVDAQSFSMPTHSNTFKYPGGWDDAEIQRIIRDTNDDYVKQRLLAEVVPPRGLVFSEFRPDLHIQYVEWAGEETPIYIWEDPGYGTTSFHAVEFAQIIDDQVQVFDEIYVRGLITKDVIDLARHRSWWKSPKFLVSDPHYKDQHHSMPSVAEVWLSETGLVAGGERVHINPGNERLKDFLLPDRGTGRPRIVFSPRCQGILSEFGAIPHPFDGPDRGNICAYKWRLDDEGRVVGEVPEDEHNHGIKAVIYGLIWKFTYGRDRQQEKIHVVRNWGQEEGKRRGHRQYRERAYVDQ